MQPTGAGVDDAFGVGGRCEEMAGALHIRFVQLFGILRPQPVISGHMEDLAAA